MAISISKAPGIATTCWLAHNNFELRESFVLVRICIDNAGNKRKPPRRAKHGAEKK